MNDTTLDTQRKRRVRRNALLLALLALGFYVLYFVVALSQR